MPPVIEITLTDGTKRAVEVPPQPSHDEPDEFWVDAQFKRFLRAEGDRLDTFSGDWIYTVDRTFVSRAQIMEAQLTVL